MIEMTAGDRRLISVEQRLAAYAHFWANTAIRSKNLRRGHACGRPADKRFPRPFALSANFARCFAMNWNFDLHLHRLHLTVAGTGRSQIGGKPPQSGRAAGREKMDTDG